MFDGGRRRAVFAGGAPVPAAVLPENALIECMNGAFAQLPDVVQRAHRGTIRLSGTVNVERGRGLGGLIALLMRLPKSNPKAELVVDAWHFDDHMIWSRSFDGRGFESTFRKEDDFLVERIGLIALVMEPKAEGGRLVYRLAETHLGPVALPRALSPSMTAWEGERDGKYTFEVVIALPIFGRVIRYAGDLDLEVLAQS